MARCNHAAGFNFNVIMQELSALAYLLIWFLISIITTVWYFKRQSLRLLRCWACHNDQFVKSYLRNQWTCSSCGNYNGFLKDGDYNKEIKEQYCNNEQEANPLLVRFTQNTSSEHHPVSMPGHLCDPCNKSEAIKMKLIRKFENLDKEAFIKSTKEIERLYPLCSSCQYLVQKKIKKLDKKVASYNQKSLQKKDSSQHKFTFSKPKFESINKSHPEIENNNNNNNNNNNKLDSNASNFMDNSDLSVSFKNKINFSSGKKMNSENIKNGAHMFFSHNHSSPNKNESFSNYDGVDKRLNFSTISPISKVSTPSFNPSTSSFSTDHKYHFLTIPVFLLTFLLCSSVVLSIFSFIPISNTTLDSSFVSNGSLPYDLSLYYHLLSNYSVSLYNIIGQFGSSKNVHDVSRGLDNDKSFCFKHSDAEDFIKLFNNKNYCGKYIGDLHEKKLENKSNNEKQGNFSILNYLIHLHLPSTLLLLNFLHHASTNFWKCKESSILSILWLSLLFFSPSFQFECCDVNTYNKCVKIYSFNNNVTIDEKRYHCSERNDGILLHWAPYICCLCSILYVLSLVRYFNQKTSLNIWNKSYKLEGSKIHLETSFMQHSSDASHNTFWTYNNSQLFKSPIPQNNSNKNNYFTPKAAQNQRHFFEQNHSFANGNINRSPLFNHNHFANVTTHHHPTYPHNNHHAANDLNTNDFFERFSSVSINRRGDAIYSSTNYNVYNNASNTNGAVANGDLPYKDHEIRPIITPSKFNIHNQTPLSF